MIDVAIWPNPEQSMGHCGESCPTPVLADPPTLNTALDGASDQRFVVLKCFAPIEHFNILTQTTRVEGVGLHELED